MEEYILKDLENNESYARMYLLHIHHLLSNCASYETEGSYSMTFQGLFQDFYFKELIDGVWGEKYVSLSTRELLHRFHVEWKKYVNATTYGDSFFVFFDSQYRDLVERTLIPALISLESDFKIHDVIDEKYESVNKFIPIGEKYNPQVLPDESTILRWIDMIYKELLGNKKITKPYMGD